MNPQELYEKQYGERKLISINSFSLLRKIFKRFDLHRNDLTLSLLVEGNKLLDVGCGSGSLAFKIKMAGKFKEICGIDISPSRIEEAKNTAIKRFGNNNNFHFSECDLNDRINFSDNMFDAAVSIATIEHIFDPYRVSEEIYRILKPGGVFIAEVPNVAYLKHRFSLLFGRLPVTSSPYNWKEIGWDGGHLHYFTKKTFCKLLEDCGFKILTVSGAGLFAKCRNFYPSLLTGDVCVKAQKF